MEEDINLNNFNICTRCGQREAYIDWICHVCEEEVYQEWIKEPIKT